MKVFRSWLADHITIEHLEDPLVVETLEDLGHEVESVSQRGGSSSIVVGQVLAVKPHPNADRLRIAIVDTGDAERTIVCGAPNLEVGQKVAVALVGSQLPGGLTIERRAIRGIESDGMICAPDELGIGDDHTGILVLPSERKVGTPFGSGLEDAVFDLAVTANRGDVLSYRGIARELAAALQLDLKTALPELRIDDSLKIEVTIEDEVACPLYTARLVEGIKPSSLPSFMHDRLLAVDHRLYHPVVDITNYCMEELGVPLHAFDAAKIQGGIVVRSAKAGESIELLDGTTYQLEPGMLIIADRVKAVAIAGVMGGLETAVTAKTTEIILEAAFFEPASIRRTRTKLGLATSASYRFERGTDPEAAGAASDLAAALIATHLGGRVGARIEAGHVPPARNIELDLDQLNRHLGTEISAIETRSILERLGFIFQDKLATIPSWRHDVAIFEDLSEEVARMHGYGRIPRTLLELRPAKSNPHDSRWRTIEAFKDVLARAGWTEHIGSSFLAERELTMLGVKPTDLVRLANPVSSEAAFLRPTQLLSLLKVIAKNPIFPDLKLFEIGTVWNRDERTMITLATTTRETDPPSPFETVQLAAPDQGLLKKLKIRRQVSYVELPIDTFLTEELNGRPVMIPPVETKFRLPSRFQPILRDSAILVNEDVDPDEIARALLKIEHVVDVELFDQFTGGKLPTGKRSLAFHLLLEHPDKTLNDQEILNIMKIVTERLTKKFAAVVR